MTNFINENEIKSNNLSFNYADLTDEQALMIKDEMINVKGFFILPSELFCNVRKRPSNIDDLNETLERVFNHIEDSARVVHQKVTLQDCLMTLMLIVINSVQQLEREMKGF